MKVIIMRGIPGSGKTHYTIQKRAEVSGTYVVSADFFHIVGQTYQFRPENAAAAHNACLNEFITVMREQYHKCPQIIVDNTNTAAWEISPYYRIAELFGHEVKIVRVCCEFETAARRNIHKVPLETIWRMYQTILTERLPAHWKEELTLSK